jgi:hypothetical protein
MVNEIRHIYQTQMGVQYLKVRLTQKIEKMSLLVALGDATIHDLTNYPRILQKSDIDSIIPNQIFGIKKDEKRVKFSKDPVYAELGLNEDDLRAS